MKKINFSFGEPYLPTEIINKINISLSVKNKNLGGLSYTDYPIIKNNNTNLIKDIYKKILKVNLDWNKNNVLIGLGTTQLFNAYCYSINKIEKKSIDLYNNNTISYNLYKKICNNTNFLNYCNSLNKIDSNNVKINFSISPNMPNSKIFNEQINNNEYYLFDVCLDYPCYTETMNSCNMYIYDKLNCNKNITIISSFSKIGIPGVHFGYLITQNNDIIKYTKEYIDINILAYPPALSIITQKIYNKYLSKITFYKKIKKIIIYRKKKIIPFLNNIEVKILNENNNNDSFPFIYTNKSQQWWNINYNIITKQGQCFENSNENSRFDLLMSYKNFEYLLKIMNSYKK